MFKLDMRLAHEPAGHQNRKGKNEKGIERSHICSTIGAQKQQDLGHTNEDNMIWREGYIN